MLAVTTYVGDEFVGHADCAESVAEVGRCGKEKNDEVVGAFSSYLFRPWYGCLWSTSSSDLITLSLAS